MSLLESAVNILVNGCSFSRGPVAWPYYIEGANITNLACAAAGVDYIFNTTIAELSQRRYDRVAIMWTAPSRLDLKVHSMCDFEHSPYTSAYQSRRNDWATKIVVPVNDQDYVEKNWVFGCGHINRDPIVTNSKAFDRQYFYQSTPQFVYLLLIKMIALQNTLKQMNVPYLFMYYQDYEAELKTYPALYQQLDQRCIYNKQNIYTITKQKNWYDDDGVHPGPQAHQRWAEIVTPLLTC
jgi:hypothetical protein